MTTDRPYQQAISIEDAVEELQQNAGTQFDPSVVAAFTSVLAESSLPAREATTPPNGSRGATTEARHSRLERAGRRVPTRSAPNGIRTRVATLKGW